MTEEIKAALHRWREDLINLTGTNRLIRFRSSKTGSVTIDAPDPDAILAGLRAGALWQWRGTLDPDETDAESTHSPPHDDVPGVIQPRKSGERVLTVRRLDKDLGPMLRNLMRRANTEFLERGLSVLYLAFGMLHWQEEDGTAMASPLLLVPVELIPQGPKSTPVLRPGEDDTVFNPALTLRMREFGLEMPDAEAVEDLSMASLLAQVASLVQPQESWHVEPTVVLSTFSFHKEAMYRDLKDHEDQIIDHPIVRALATQDPTRQSGEFIFEPIGPADIDQAAPPEDTPLVLDADSSQRAAVAAALAGGTFVMDGPPGTGKSQTIANMVGALLHAGKSVLFVSEKAAALEVVRNRLAEAGLENYLLELHSHKASRKEVSAALARALDNEPHPPKGMDGLTRESLIDTRQRLNNYAEAMNQARQPLELSLHEVLGILGNLNHLPAAPVPESAPAELTQSGYRQVQETARGLERAWRPAQQGSTFLWREVIDEDSLEIRLYRSEAAFEELDGIVATNQELADAFGITKPSQAPILAALIDHQHSRPPGALEGWLLSEDWEAISKGRDRLAAALHSIEQAEKTVTETAGLPWTALPAPETLPDPAAGQRPNDTDGSNSTDDSVDLGGLDAHTCSQAATRFDQVATRLQEQLAAVQQMAAHFGLSPVTSFADAERVCALADLAFVEDRPLRTWLSPEGLAAAREASTRLRNCVAALDATEAEARTHFTDAALSAPLTELQERFTHQHTGLKKLSGAYRADKKTLSALLTSGTDLRTAIGHLPQALAWAEAEGTFHTEATDRAGILGPYWDGRQTNFARLQGALNVAAEILTQAGSSGVPPALAEHLTAAHPAAGLQRLIEQIRSEFKDWKNSLAPAPALAGRPELMLAPIENSLTWLHAQVGPLRAASARIRAVDQATGRQHTLDAANHLLELAQAAAAAHASMQAEQADYQTWFEGHYRAEHTDMRTLDTALAWARAVRGIAGGALSADQAKALAECRNTENLPAAITKWAQARDRILAAFAASRRDELARELDDYRGGPEFLSDLRQDSLGQQEWFSYLTARDQLAQYGLDAAVDFCIEQRVPAHQVPGVLERALLRGWADEVIRTDPRLRPTTSKDRSALVEEYRDLDRKLIISATSDIIRAANTRRPANGNFGEPALIRREGMKKRRHIAVRELIAKTKNASLALKPCFMMSPLAVSQYLPADMRFDVVIFDEASQVTPGDAINCIYRGNALILAGDDKQLPPTSFFERVVDEEDEDTDVTDFQSILELAKACGAFNNLGLKWHYRSRHESLIAFSNAKFYEGKLITYPSSQSEGPDVGVEFIHAHGTYRRGGGADNPTEAARVAQRVIHHFSTRPNMSLGVVTFSVAQADAIIDALDKAREERRDLDRFFDTNDRLDGFFVRSLESVQGDERDVMIFSIGYGPDEAGKIATNFGVLNRDKGWRRLNVAITRARQRVEVVASLRAGDIPPSSNENVEYLRAYLDYAERGQAALAIDLGPSGLGPESPFEESVINTLRGWGYVVEPQVGAAGFRIDIGVRHPAHPGTFVLGVECDGFQYHSAPAARDRDRLRDQVLRGLGWNLHRIWGTAWYRNRAQEEDRLRAAVETAINSPTEGRPHATERLQRPAVRTVEVEINETPIWTSEYTTARLSPLPRWIDPSDPGSKFDMVPAMQALAEHEGPVHLDLVHQRVREAWGIGKVGYRIRDNIEGAIQIAQVTREGDFIDVPDRPIDRVRIPGEGFRKVDQVHHGELRLAATLLLRDIGSEKRDDLVVAIARVFGWNRVGSDIQRRVNEAVDQLLATREIVEDEAGYLTLPTPTG